MRQVATYTQTSADFPIQWEGHLVTGDPFNVKYDNTGLTVRVSNDLIYYHAIRTDELPEPIMKILVREAIMFPFP